MDLSLWDALRLLVIVAALWLAALVISVGLKASRERPGREPVHPLTYASFALLLFLTVAMRFQHFGHPPTWDLFVAVIAVGLGLAGVLLRVRLNNPVQGRPRQRGARR